MFVYQRVMIASNVRKCLCVLINDKFLEGNKVDDTTARSINGQTPKLVVFTVGVLCIPKGCPLQFYLSGDCIEILSR